MRERMDPKTWKREYEDFCRGEEVTPPPQLSELILARVSRAMNPSPWMVFAKLCLVTVFGGGFSLAFCPQFGLGITRHSEVLMDFFEHLGSAGCQVACGAVFLGMSTIAASLILQIEEMRLIHRTKFLQIPAVALLALSFLVCAGADVLIESALFWWLGAVIVGIATLELGYVMRIRVWERSLS